MFEEHRQEYSDNKIMDFLDVYLKEIQAKKDVKGTSVEDKSCQATMYDMLWHGTTVTAATLQWALVFLLGNGEVKDKLYAELKLMTSDAEAVKDAPPAEGSVSADRTYVYVQAFINEVQRCANVCQLSMAHAVAKEKFLKGFRVPGDAVILPNLDSLMMDPDIWGDPFVFRPERFINDGKVSSPPEFIPFFFGLRDCPGSEIAHTILSTFLTSILFNFDLQSEIAGEPPATTRQKGLVPLPKEFKTKFVAR